MRRGRRLPISILVALALVAVSEAVVRAVSSRLPPPLTWGDWEVQNKVERIDALAARGGASIVAAGSSIMNAALDPQSAARMFGARRPVFNAALNGADARTTDLWVRRIVAPRLRPDIAVIGVSAIEVNDNGLTQRSFFRRFTRAPSLRRLIGSATVVETLEGELNDRFALFRYRTSLRQPAETFRALTGRPPGVGSDSASRVAGAAGPLGTLAVMPSFHARPFQIREEFRLRTTEESFHRFSVGGAQTRALTTLIRTLRSQRIEPVLVDMPVTDDVITMLPQGRTDLDAFARALRELAAAHAVRLIDMRSRIGSDHRWFVDPVHLNGRGAALFTETLVPLLRDARRS